MSQNEKNVGTRGSNRNNGDVVLRKSFDERVNDLKARIGLDSHHTMERLAILTIAIAVIGAMIVVAAGVAAVRAGHVSLSSTALYTPTFTTSRTGLQGTVDGVYRNTNGDKALVVMGFDEQAQVSYRASDYEVYVLGSDTKLRTQGVSTDGITGTVYSFGSTGHIGVLLDADEPFDQQVLNITMRSNAELTYDEQAIAEGGDDIASDASFDKHDQWRIFCNPGASEVGVLDALDALNFDPARAYYEVVLRAQEDELRARLDSKLLEMRTSLAQIDAYTADLETTKVDDLFLRPPEVPAVIADDEVTGVSAAESDDDTSTLMLDTDRVVPGGFNFNWRTGNVYDGYLDALVGEDQSVTEYLAAKRAEVKDTTSTSGVTSIRWVLSDGSDLERDYQSSDVTMRPLITVMNNLSNAYQSYYQAKSDYQSSLLLELLGLDVDLRGVQTNSSSHEGDDAVHVRYR